MISPANHRPWQVNIVGGGESFTIVIMATNRAQAHQAADELYPHSFIRVVGLAPEWDDAA